MENNQTNEIVNNWLAITNIQMGITNELERALQKQYNLSLNEFYVLYFLSQTIDKRLRLQQLQEMVGLSQSAMSRLVNRLEAKSCGVLERHICEDDRRGIYTSLTAKGEEKLQNCLHTFHKIIHTTFSNKHLQLEIQSLIQKI
ncbi:MarR family transcriptional regulator [Bacillus pfraonensis]|uniref:MarR family winged helix-turn-helix transcriptional regulator n=1 Tax=Bacillus TaxID=1386 RepID=UPI002A52ACD9|nr:MarR family transcriptional regulator [Bacillus pseudomycoides]